MGGDYLSMPFSKIDPDITYEQGSLVEQWTVKFQEPTTKQYAIITIRYSKQKNTLIEFDTELSPLLKEKKGKEVTMTWHLYDSYDGNDTFWTDSNGLEMQERHTVRFSKSNISANFYPVTSAIATRSVPTAGTNESSQPMLQVTVMTERSTGGAADLTERATIELIHERSSRNMSTLEEPGNSTKAPNKSKYWMQILEVNKGKSLQRMKQLIV